MENDVVEIIASILRRGRSTLLLLIWFDSRNQGLTFNQGVSMAKKYKEPPKGKGTGREKAERYGHMQKKRRVV